MQQLTTVYQKYVIQNDQSVTPTFKNVEDGSPNSPLDRRPWPLVTVFKLCLCRCRVVLPGDKWR